MNKAQKDLVQVNQLLSQLLVDEDKRNQITYDILQLLTTTVTMLCDKVRKIIDSSRPPLESHKSLRAIPERKPTKKDSKRETSHERSKDQHKKEKRMSESSKTQRKSSFGPSVNPLQLPMPDVLSFAPKTTREYSSIDQDDVPIGSECFKKWTGKSLKVIYDSIKQPFNAKALWSCIKDKKDIVIFVRTNKDEIFGGYFSRLPEHQGEWVVDPKHFIFRLNGDKGVKMMGTGRNDCLNIGEDHDVNRVCTIGGFITIMNHQCIFHVEEDFNDFYIDFTGKGREVFGGCSPFQVVKFWVTELVVL
ncbi:TLDc domain-containing protein [Entamoeba marina]